MKPASSWLLRSARLILPAAVVLTAMGATAAVATPVQARLPAGHIRGTAASPVKFTWHPLKLKGGWESASSTQAVTGTPAWAIHDGVVYLRGAIKQAHKGSAIFGSLPVAARPASVLYLQVFSKSAVPGVLYIGSGGELQAYYGNTNAFTSLAGVSFPTAAITSHQLKLLNGWQSEQPIYRTGNPSYAISHGVVYLSGSLSNSGSSVLAFKLPKAARPKHTMYISVYTNEGISPGQVTILPQGEVDIDGGNANGYTSLANISFPVPGTKWHNFTLESGWKPYTSFADTAPAYAVINGVVYLNGAMHQPLTGGNVWANIPAGAQTADVADIEVLTTGGSAGAVKLTPRRGIASSTPGINAQTMTSLAGIAYPPSS